MTQDMETQEQYQCGGALPDLHSTTYIYKGVETEVRLVEHLEIVKKAPYLEFLEVEFVSSKLAGPDDLQLPATTLHNLHTLVVNGSNVSMSIIRNLILPSLRRLICGPFGPANYQNIKGLVDMVKRNRPPLEYLEICNTSVTESTEDKIVALLRLLPDLKALRMEKVYVTPDLFNILSVKDTTESRNESQRAGQILCPKLMEFYLRRNGYLCNGEGKQKECVDSLCNMLEERCNALGIVGSIEYRPIEPYLVGEILYFSVPFVDIGCRQMRKALRTTKQLHVRFKKPLTVES
ncbi:uncharacterized protein FOMMEDRAFT_152281 [Fomitiporia mediterranea MF3/22]|uniref:uncharacterized protein n=1 Tax=Fomitiporia mediterranea (strain MF3/22) TaxID=694068 RepID=UPI00044080DA|nr:uncharacterized protein FOMMEDRAFT_152281 [Fomitiporia mediterranea MF3/22]EJD06943.1 hypothetical protein FOMMEDRAFT_152281 [Fomitiporia mediterranea MF3/22]